MATPPAQGRFVWHELRTPDPAAAEAFYGALYGWKFADGAGGYRLIHIGGSDVGGLRPIEAEGQAPHWLPFVTVDAAGEALERARPLGGVAIGEPATVPGIGRFAVTGDPRGAVLSLYEPDGGPLPEPEGPPSFGSFCWNELLTDDPDAARVYYTALLGWDTVDYVFGSSGKYVVFRRGEHDAAGMVPIPANSPHPPHWLCYLRSEDVDARTAKVAELGGWVLVPPAELPQIGRVSICADPQGGIFALFTKAEERTKPD